MAELPADRRDFFDEQARRRRSAWVFSAICLLIASGIGIVMSTVVTPLLLVLGGWLLFLLARFGAFADTLRGLAHGLGIWAQQQSAHFMALIDSLDQVNHVSDLRVTISPLLQLAPVAVPALVAAGLVWIVLWRISLRGEAEDLVVRLRARPARPTDLEEHQLTNIVAEMAIAAALPTPDVWLIDSPEVNAAALGGGRGPSRILVTSGLLDQLDRDETSGVVAHLMASIGAGDLRLMHAILAVFQTFGFFLSFLDLPFRWSAWTALGGLILVASGLRRDPAAVAATLEAVERGMDANAMPNVDNVWSTIPWPRVRKVLLVPLLPLILVSIILRVSLFLWTALFLGPPLAMIWRNRRYAADAMAVQLTRNPDGLARALTRIGGSAVLDGSEGREYCFIQVPATASRRGIAARRTMTVSLHPPLHRRLDCLQALGAGVAKRPKVPWIEEAARNPARALLAGVLLLLLVPLGGILVLAVLYLTAIAMTLGLAAGLAVATGVLG